MASHIDQNGAVQPPLNISAPAPILDLRGFHWSTVDEKINGTQRLEHNDEAVLVDGHAATHQERLVANGKPASEVAALEKTSLPASLPAPQLPAQLLGQLGLVPGKPPPKLPSFPLTHFQGAYAGNGFNTIFRPRPSEGKRAPSDKTDLPLQPVDTGGLPDDNILELNLTTEQLTFGGTIGHIPNRGSADQADITLEGFPYLQTIQDVTNTTTGRGDNPKKNDIHFEPGMWLNVPESKDNPANDASVVRMASIPHGTTIHAQCLAPQKVKTSTSGWTAGGPKFDALNIAPFPTGTPFPVPDNARIEFPSLKVANKRSARIPQNLDKFDKAKTITDDIIRNPNLVLENAIAGQKIIETVTFQVSTGLPQPFLNGGGTRNISFLAGKQVAATDQAPNPDVSNPNAHAAFMTSKFWIETVAYQVTVEAFTTPGAVRVKPTMPNKNAPTPEFLITPPTKLPTQRRTITVPGTQIQYSQTVNLDFAGLTWPHVSVATLVPSGPQPFQMT